MLLSPEELGRREELPGVPPGPRTLRPSASRPPRGEGALAQTNRGGGHSGAGAGPSDTALTHVPP